MPDSTLHHEGHLPMPLTNDPFSVIQAVTACGVIVRDVIDDGIVAANQTAAEILAVPLTALLPSTTSPG